MEILASGVRRSSRTQEWGQGLPSEKRDDLRSVKDQPLGGSSRQRVSGLTCGRESSGRAPGPQAFWKGLTLRQALLL